MALDPIELGLFESRLSAVCEEMGVRLRNAAFSTNIQDRLDFSCAVFDGCGKLSAQAAHIPVHLGSMAHAMSSIVASVEATPQTLGTITRRLAGAWGLDPREAAGRGSRPT